MNVDYRKYAYFNYVNQISDRDKFRLGDVVINKYSREIGVIIQVHSPIEFRTDMFGNCSDGEIEKASLLQIVMYRPDILD